MTDTPSTWPEEPSSVADEAIRLADELSAMSQEDVERFVSEIEAECSAGQRPEGKSDYAQRTLPGESMNGEEIIAWLLHNVIPVRSRCGTVWRAGAMLEGGFFLPCVAFVSRTDRCFRQLERLKPEMNENEAAMLRNALRHPGNTLSLSTIRRVLPSPYALPGSFYDRVEASRPGRDDARHFWAEMYDGSRWQFRCHDPLFLELPPGYAMGDIREITIESTLEQPHLNVRPAADGSRGWVSGYAGRVLGEMPYFWCPGDGLLAEVPP